jgi:hypothetical protein
VGRKGLGICSSESIVNLGKSAILYLWYQVKRYIIHFCIYIEKVSRWDENFVIQQSGVMNLITTGTVGYDLQK